MNLIQVLLQLLVLFGGRNSTRQEISNVLSVIVNVAHVLMEEIHLRDKRAEGGDDTSSPFSPGNWDIISKIEADLKPKPKAAVKRSSKLKPKSVLN
jgi:hypothetical protein